MARRYGGAYSPGGTGAATAHDVPAVTPAMAQRHPVGARINMLFVLPFLFAIKAFFAEPLGLALTLGGFGALLLAAWLTREGALAQAAYDARKVARRPAIPRKIFGSALTGLGLGLVGLAGGPAEAAIFGSLGAALHFGAFGADPLRDKGMDGIDAHQTDRAARAIEDAEDTLAEMADAIRRAADRALVDRVDRFATNIRPLFRAVQDDPRQLSAARRYLGVYLTGARDATVKFADLYARERDMQARRDYEALLDDLESQFALRRAALLEDNRTDLDIEIEVLRERLDREGIRRDA